MIGHLFSMLLGAALLWTAILVFVLNRGSPLVFISIAALAIIHLAIEMRSKIL